MITVGLDFGTHQTKICIENGSNPNQKTYEFFEFAKGEDYVFSLPSIVQINKDKTISYGFFDESDCLINSSGFRTDPIEKLVQPKLDLPQRPLDTSFPEMPKKRNYPKEPAKLAYPERKSVTTNVSDWKDQLAKLKQNMLYENEEAAYIASCQEIDKINSSNYLAWKKICESIDWNYENRFFVPWRTKCREIEKSNREKDRNYEFVCTELFNAHDKALKEYYFLKNQLPYLVFNEDGIVLQEKMIFHYFKFALYSDQVKWHHQISPETISIWYICNILFTLQQKLGEDFSTQIGVPCGLNQQIDDVIKSKGVGIIISAYKLLDSFTSHSDFLNTTYHELLNRTKQLENYNENDRLFYGVEVLPEAYAGLIALTKGKKLENGMNLLVDIGGGTTDIAFFTITENNLPDIHIVTSLYKGLNSIFETISLNSDYNDIIQVHSEIDNPSDETLLEHTAVNIYQQELLKLVRAILGSVKDSFRNKFIDNSLDISKLMQALKNRPVVFSGGGSTFHQMNREIDTFTDVKRINQDFLSIKGLISTFDDDNLFPIFATAYGLSIPLEDDIELTPISDMFSQIILDQNSDNKSQYTHGLSDF